MFVGVWLGWVGRWWWSDGAGAVSRIDWYVTRPEAAAWQWFGAGRAMFLGYFAALGFAGIGVAAVAALSWRGRPWIAAPTGIIAATAALGAGLIAAALESKDLWHLHGHAVHDSCMNSSYHVAVLASAGLGLLALPAAFSPLLAPRAQG